MKTDLAYENKSLPSSSSLERSTCFDTTICAFVGRLGLPHDFARRVIMLSDQFSLLARFILGERWISDGAKAAVIVSSEAR